MLVEKVVEEKFKVFLHFSEEKKNLVLCKGIPTKHGIFEFLNFYFDKIVFEISKIKNKI